MVPTARPRHSLKTRITLITLAIFVGSIWTLWFFSSQMLHKDMERLLSEQQFSTVSLLASQLDGELVSRLKALERAAGSSTSAMLDGPAAMQSLIEQQPSLADLFNAGVIAYDPHGTAIAEVPRSTGRVGLNYMDNETVARAVTEGKSTISRVHMGKKLRAPVFGMTVPTRDANGNVIGALSGVISLGMPNFLDRVMAQRYGNSGGYLLIAPQQRLVVTATDKARIMEALPAPGVNPVIDRYLDGYEGSAVFVNPVGQEVLNSDARIPVAGWILAASLPTSEAFAPVHEMEHRILVATLFLTLVAGLLTWGLLSRQLSPMLATARTLANLSETNQPPQALPVGRHDEIGELIGGFNMLLGTLAKRELALQESEERSRILVAELQVGVLIQSSTAEILLSNQSALDLLGLTEDQLLGKTSFDPDWNVIHEDGSPFPGPSHPVPQAIAIRQAVANVIMGVYRPSTRDRIWLMVNAKPQLNPDGSVRQVVCTFGNITERKQAEDALRESEGFTRTVLDSVFDQIAVIEHEGVIVRVNQPWVEFAVENGIDHVSPAPHTDVGTNYLDVFQGSTGSAADGSHQAREGIQAVLDGRLPSFNMAYPCHSPDEQRWFRMRVTPFLNRGRRGAVIAHTNITEIKKAEEALRASEERLSLVLRGTQDGFWDWDLVRDEFYYSPRWWHMLGYAEGELAADSKLWRRLMHPDDADRVNLVLAAALEAGTKAYEVEFRLLHKYGHYLNLISRGFILRNAKGKAIRISGANMDITERKLMEDRVRHMAFYDSLTELPNRRLLMDRLSQALAATSRSGNCGALMFLDLDNFKPLNDSYGHEAGDSLLVEVASRIRNSIREMDTVARFGGDEFVVMLPELIGDLSEATAQTQVVANKIHAIVSEPYLLTIKHAGKAEVNIQHRCTASIGVTIFLDHEVTQDEVLMRADAAMYQAKATGRNAIKFYDSTPCERLYP